MEEVWRGSVDLWGLLLNRFFDGRRLPARHFFLVGPCRLSVANAGPRDQRGEHGIPHVDNDVDHRANPLTRSVVRPSCRRIKAKIRHR